MENRDVLHDRIPRTNGCSGVRARRINVDSGFRPKNHFNSGCFFKKICADCPIEYFRSDRSSSEMIW